MAIREIDMIQNMEFGGLPPRGVSVPAETRAPGWANGLRQLYHAGNVLPAAGFAELLMRIDAAVGRH